MIHFIALPAIVKRFQRHHVVRLRYALGWPAILGSLIMVVLLLNHFSFQPLLTRRLKEVEQLVKKPVRSPLKIQNIAPKFPWAAFPSRTQESALHSLFYVEAAKLGLNLPEVRYLQRPVVGTPLIEHRIELNTTTNYPTLKKWMAVLMSTYPTLVLEHLRIERDTVQSEIVKCDMKWVWYAHDGSAEALKSSSSLPEATGVRP